MAEKPDWKRYERDSAKLDKVHSCPADHNLWTARVSSPGFEETHVGASRWTCDTCRPLFIELFDACFGGHVVIPKAAR